MTRWYVKFEGAAYANGPFEAPSLVAAKRDVRDWLGVTRLPNGTEFWKA